MAKQFITKDGRDLTLYPYYNIYQKQTIIKERHKYHNEIIKEKWLEIKNNFKKAFFK